ncbi:MAG: hypothetical protein IIB81_04840 [Nanoarchaeota archaeon]|nr:hypothetical protein [Nanoarchaeota archaeon]
MAVEIFLQNIVFTKFVLPFLLIFFIVFAILEKTNVFGDDKKQTNALIAFVIGLIFVGVAFPKEVVENLILFLTVALVVVFVILILWGFVSGKKLEIESKGLRLTVGVVILVSVIIAVLWATGIQGGVLDLLFGQSWSGAFWTNALFVILFGAALALVLRNSK